ncbi:hypothetical protein [Mesorhizobium sp. A623]
MAISFCWAPNVRDVSLPSLILLMREMTGNSNAVQVEADNVGSGQLPGKQAVATSVLGSPDDQAETPAFVNAFAVSLRKLLESCVELGILHFIPPVLIQQTRSASARGRNEVGIGKAFAEARKTERSLCR